MRLPDAGRPAPEEDSKVPIPVFVRAVNTLIAAFADTCREKRLRGKAKVRHPGAIRQEKGREYLDMTEPQRDQAWWEFEWAMDGDEPLLGLPLR